MAKYIAKEMGKDVSEMTYDYLTSKKFRDDFGQATFFTATDGNHGRGVAWAANKLGQKAVVHMPKGSTQTRFDNIAKEGASVTIEELNYDDCVRLAAKEAAETPHGVIVQDTAWDGYEEIPSWIMQGYGSMAGEAAEQLREVEVNRPTHVFVQAGVGSLAGGVVGYFANLYPNNPPKFIVMEAGAADCLYKGAEAGDGRTKNRWWRSSDNHGRSCLWRTKYNWMGYFKKPCFRIYFLSRLGICKGYENACSSSKRRSIRNIRRIRSGRNGSYFFYYDRRCLQRTQRSIGVR